MTASFLAVAEIAETLPFLKAMRLKKLEGLYLLNYQMALAAFCTAILSLLLPLGILWLSTLPTHILLLRHRRSQLANCLAL